MGSHIPCVNENGVQVTGISEVNRSLKRSSFQGIIPIHGGRQSLDLAENPIFGKIFAENCIKIIEIGWGHP